MNTGKRNLQTVMACVGVLCIVLCFVGCKEDIDTSNRYTFTGNTVASFLEEHEDLFSDFITILKRGGKYNLMKAYGTYTCFAPTNDAVEQFLVEQDSIYKASLLPGAKKVIWTGVTSPNFDDLTDSMCTVIAQTHLLTKSYLTTEMEGDVVPTMNLNDRYLTMSYDTDSLKRSVIYVNGAEVIAGDQEVENGVVHTISKVMNPSSNTVPAQIENMPFLSIFSEALEKTGLDDQLQAYKDYDYKDGDKKTLTIYNVSGCPYPPTRYFGFTAFCEPDEVFYNYGINNVDELYEQCKVWYPNATDEDFESENNALNRFIAYHLLDRKLPYSRLVCYNITVSRGGSAIYKSETNYVSRSDRFDYFETMQGTMLKVTMPRSNSTYATDILLNYAREVTNPANPYDVPAGSHDARVNVRVMNPSTVVTDKERYPDYNQEALNGSILLLDNFLVYDEDVMAGQVLNEIMRIDFSSIVPEFTNNNIRWSSGENIDFAASSDYEFYIPDGYSDRLKYNSEETRLYYLSPHTSWADYQGDECMCLGAFDFAYRIPHVPAGTYELRMGYSANSNRGMIQFYVDDEVTGIPTDLRKAMTVADVGWVADAQTEDNGVANDKEMKNRGWLKGPTTFYYGGSMLLRNYSSGCRRVITTKYLTEGDHWLRFKNVNDQDDGLDQFMHDYLEIVPVGWLRREDLSLEEKRK